MPTKLKIFQAPIWIYIYIYIYISIKNLAVITISRFTIERIQPATGLIYFSLHDSLLNLGRIIYIIMFCLASIPQAYYHFYGRFWHGSNEILLAQNIIHVGLHRRTCEVVLGWCSVAGQMDLIKLNFAYKLMRLEADNIIKYICLCQIVVSGTVDNTKSVI